MRKGGEGSNRKRRSSFDERNEPKKSRDVGDEYYREGGTPYRYSRGSEEDPRSDKRSRHSEGRSPQSSPRYHDGGEGSRHRSSRYSERPRDAPRDRDRDVSRDRENRDHDGDQRRHGDNDRRSSQERRERSQRDSESRESFSQNYEKADQDRDEGRSRVSLFEDTKSTFVDRKLEKAIAQITLEMLEAVRIRPRTLIEMLEHPRADEFLIGAYVRYPDLEAVESNMEDPYDEVRVKSLPAQISKCQTLSFPETIRLNDGQTVKSPIALTIIQYVQRDDESLKIRKAGLVLDWVRKDPFTADELQHWKSLLKLFSGRSGSEKLQMLPQILPTKASKLANFTFTEEDVKAMLQRRAQDSEAGRYAGIATLNWRDLYLRKAELEFVVNDIRAGISQEGEEDAEVDRDEQEKKIEEIEGELRAIAARLEFLRSEESKKATDGPVQEQPSITLSKPAAQAGVGMDSLTTPKFLQTRGQQGSASSQPDWRQFEWVKNVSKPSWCGIHVLLDKVYRPYTQKEKLHEQIRKRWSDHAQKSENVDQWLALSANMLRMTKESEASQNKGQTLKFNFEEIKADELTLIFKIVTSDYQDAQEGGDMMFDDDQQDVGETKRFVEQTAGALPDLSGGSNVEDFSPPPDSEQ